MRRLYVEIDDRAFDRLASLAVKERRDVRDQAAVLLQQTLAAPPRRRGPAEESATWDPPLAELVAGPA